GGLNIIEMIQPEIEKLKDDATIKQYKKAIKFIEEGIERTSKIVNALMDFSSQKHIELKEHNIHEVIDNTLLFLRTNIPDDIEIQKNYNLKTNVPIFVDNLHQVLLNILNNALFELKHVASNNKTIIISTKQDTKNAHIQIFNNNSKISEDNLIKIFDPFYTTKDPNKGTGLGLSISYSLMTEMGSEIIVENENDGVCFILTIPLKNSNK
ncbi:MAG: HAMP domain-containing sensor histidine kinase, partial [Bacteroidota bacterium]|nr:HAMP domain-containing sensor histidine kinase [Bacteroidota bacterium]